MRRTALLLTALVLAAACRESAGPSVPHNAYALARVGAARLPISFMGDGTPPFLVADTFRLTQDRSRTDPRILRRVLVVQQGSTPPTTRTEADYAYEISDGKLRYDDCPIGGLCIASLVYAPRVFQIVGDSLFEIVPPGASFQTHVYGRVRY